MFCARNVARSCTLAFSPSPTPATPLLPLYAGPPQVRALAFCLPYISQPRALYPNLIVVNVVNDIVSRCATTAWCEVLSCRGVCLPLNHRMPPPSQPSMFLNTNVQHVPPAARTLEA